MMRRTEKLKEAFEGACPQRIWKSRPIDEGLFVINCDGMNQTDAELCGASMVHEGNLGNVLILIISKAGRISKRYKIAELAPMIS